MLEKFFKVADILPIKHNQRMHVIFLWWVFITKKRYKYQILICRGFWEILSQVVAL